MKIGNVALEIPQAMHLKIGNSVETKLTMKIGNVALNETSGLSTED